MGEGTIYLIIFIGIIYMIIKSDDKKNKQPNKSTRSGAQGKDHIRFITAKEIFYQKTNRYPNMGKEDDIIEFIRCYNSEGNQNQMAGDYNRQQPHHDRPQQQQYYGGRPQ